VSCPAGEDWFIHRCVYVWLRSSCDRHNDKERVLHGQQFHNQGLMARGLATLYTHAKRGRQRRQVSVLAHQSWGKVVWYCGCSSVDASSSVAG
jgi:hypothetical protein